MYNRAPRVINQSFNQTPPVVGPTTYNIDNDVTRVNAVPFLSTEERVPQYYRKGFCDTFYDVSDSTKPVKGGSTPRNKALRFTYNESDTPSPGDYHPKIQGTCQRNVPPGVRPKKLYVCRTPHSVKGSAPSVPIDSYGYRLSRNDSLIKIPPKERDTTIGPAYYQVPCGAFPASDKGCKWSGRTGKRSSYMVDENPSPTAYDVEFPECRKRCEEEQVREMARRFSFVPRYLEAQEMKIRKEDLPGPARYSVDSYEACKICPSLKRRPFISGSRRFTVTVSQNPDPARYNIVNIKYSVSKKDVPFSVESSRFIKKKIEESPGPASYNIKSPLTERLLAKKNLRSLVNVPHNKPLRREVSAVSPDAAAPPLPADYYNGVQSHCKILVSSVFKSKAQRFKPICKKDGVSPATYDALGAFKNATDKVSHQVFEVSFNATAIRGDQIEEEERPELIEPLPTGPADYCSQMDLSPKGHFIPISTRFEMEPSGPGPGTYYGVPSGSYIGLLTMCVKL